MNKHLQNVVNIIQADESLSAEQKSTVLKSLKDADKELEIATFKLDRTEKIKRTTAILLEETIAELEQKRKSVEAQNRDLEIEAAVERVRATAMAMQSTREFEKVSQQLLQQVKILNLEGFTGSSICLIDENQFMSWWDFASPGNIGDPKSQTYRYDAKKYKVLGRNILEEWQKGEPYMVFDFNMENLLAGAKEWEDIDVNIANTFKTVISEGKLTHQWNPTGRLSNGFLTFDMVRPPDEDVRKITIKMAHAFDQAYTRFLDLQKAEAQARESQIQLALERVRSRTMAMHKSAELAEVAVLMYHELKALGVNQEFFECGYIEIDEADNIQRAWSTRPDGSFLEQPYYLPLKGEPVIDARYEAWLQRIPVFHQEVGGGQWQQHLDYILPYFGNKEAVEISISSIVPDPVHFYFGNFDHGCLNINCGAPLSVEGESLLSRFTRVFEMTYKRFLDLQKAEAQAREAQIEAALERVRSKTMAMHNSEDVGNTVATMFDELVKLGIETIRCGIGILHENEPMEVWTAKSNSHGEITLIIGRLDMRVHPLLQGIYHAWKSKQPTFSYEMIDEDLKDYYRAINNLPDYPIRFDIESLPPKQIHTDFYFPEGALFAFTYEPIAADASQILKRFAGVFGQTYRRYLDLQKAEAQAREAQIEAALERVRSRSMAMHKTVELAEVISTIFIELGKLDVILVRCLIAIYDYKTYDANWWMANSEVPEKPINLYIKHLDVPANIAFNTKLREKPLKWVYIMEGDEKKEWDERMLTETELSTLPEEVKRGMRDPAKSYVHASFNNFGCLSFVSLEQLSDSNFDIIIRFSKVFEQSYTRFLDLQKAEAQAREAQIEAALERVRARTMAMQRSEELPEVAGLLFQQVKTLGVPQFHCGFNIFDIDDKECTWYPGSADGDILPPCKIPLTEHPVFMAFNESRKRGDELFVYEKEGEYQAGHYRYMLSLPVLGEILQNMLDAGIPFPTFQIDHLANFSHGNLLFITSEHFPEMHDTFKRFAKVFEQTYTRFLDLQKAEAQAREAQIEAALERVRARMMAMHHSDGLPETMKVIADQILALGMRMDSINFLPASKDKDFNFWSATTEQTFPVKIFAPYLDHPLFNKLYEGMNSGEDCININLSREESRSWWRHFLEKSNAPNYLTEQRKQFLLNSSGYTCSAVCRKNSLLNLAKYSGDFTFTEEENAILKRFANVFDQSYTRFLDLQKAEAQAREATIEAALEKVRGKAMAMHSSNDLTTTAGVVFTELKRLGINSFRSGVGLIETKESRLCKIYSAIFSEEGDTLSLSGTLMLADHPVLSNIGDAIVNQTDYFVVLQGELLESYYEIISSAFNISLTKSKYEEEFGCFLTFSGGGFYVWSDKPYTESEIKILQRFKAIVDLTFRRYIELQRAEANALEAVRSASLDRIRAEIASMRTTKDLDRITPLIWKELNILGIPFVRCGVFFMDEATQHIHTFLSTPEGKAIAAFHLPFDTPGKTGDIFRHWTKKQNYINHWLESDFSDLGDTLVKQGALPSKEVYMNTVPREGIYLHCLPFMQGMLYVGNTVELKEGDIQLIQSVADAFSTAYARYEDFNKLEAAKQQVDKTLVDLKQTQAQLVQSEKMASLGELTAGIAHEIQNPLNFVNNFSEVSTELVDEMNEEFQKGNTEDAMQIAADLKQNLVKINHHGKRADAIVKGMLQHSRSSSGQKEPTDINALCDEYLRLSYHGLRAKDNSFNAKFETHLDPALPKIKVVPQDIGRVVLNLINNAFYAVSEKQKAESAKPGSSFEPTVIVSTHYSLSPGEGRLSRTSREGEAIITVQDNGPGIPDSIKEKIFQPFFTTKPTGQGTGLGLSLSYDIIKAHGGELKVETREGAGTTFIISIPVS
jgi:signal transduction histidine kinase